MKALLVFTDYQAWLAFVMADLGPMVAQGSTATVTVVACRRRQKLARGAEVTPETKSLLPSSSSALLLLNVVDLAF